VVKIEVVETGSAAKASIGSGFFVTAAGEVITNYHVISKLIHTPERYRAELVDARGTRSPVRVLGVDVVHDLAVLRGELRPRTHFTLAATPIAQGSRIYSLGHPEDLGLSIVEGTYNGLLSHTLHPRIHFTGAVNPGMSGGPAITDDGAVIGINVATSGDAISFLVPVERAIALVARALS
jgi:serine protease Do